jgi:hypothetical protein
VSTGFVYLKGGYIATVGETAVSKTLQDIIRARDLPGLQTEFDRIYGNVESDPASAITASCALLESLSKDLHRRKPQLHLRPPSGDANGKGRYEEAFPHWFLPALTLFL